MTAGSAWVNSSDSQSRDEYLWELEEQGPHLFLGLCSCHTEGPYNPGAGPSDFQRPLVIIRAILTSQGPSDYEEPV